MYAQVYTGLHIVMRFGFSVYANVYACWIQYICQGLRVRAYRTAVWVQYNYMPKFTWTCVS